MTSKRDKIMKSKKSKRSVNKNKRSKSKRNHSSRKFYGFLGDGCPLGSTVLVDKSPTPTLSDLIPPTLSDLAYSRTLPCYKNCKWNEKEDYNSLYCKPLIGKGKRYARERVDRD